MAATGEGDSTLLSLVDAKGDPAGITGLAYRDATGKLIRTGKAKQRDWLGRDGLTHRNMPSLAGGPHTWFPKPGPLALRAVAAEVPQHPPLA